jgi:inosose dehydratase
MNRRDFVLGSAAALAANRFSRFVARPTFGYAAITWNGNDRAAMDDIASVGYRGIQLRTSAFTEFEKRPAELAHLLAARGLTFVALSGGVVSLDPAKEASDIALQERQAKFVREAGGLYLQVVDERPRGRAPTNDDYRRMGRLLTEIGRRTADHGVALGYHNHMGNLGQAPDEVARVLDATDPRFVQLELDVAHYQAAGGNPAEAVRQYGERVLFLHLKDLQTPIPGQARNSYRFVELGQGSVDVIGVLAELDRTAFRGWAIVELDSVPVATRSPKESAVMSRRFLESNGYTV